jgi:hypothetical protein
MSDEIPVNSPVAPEDVERLRQKLPDTHVKWEGLAGAGKVLSESGRHRGKATRSMPAELISAAPAAAKSNPAKFGPSFLRRDDRSQRKKNGDASARTSPFFESIRLSAQEGSLQPGVFLSFHLHHFLEEVFVFCRFDVVHVVFTALWAGL